jgi:hypothetical protein
MYEGSGIYCNENNNYTRNIIVPYGVSGEQLNSLKGVYIGADVSRVNYLKDTFNVGDEDSVFCEHCGDTYCESDCTYIENDWYCNDCYIELFANCVYCEEDLLKEDLIEVYGGELVCIDCLGNHYNYCEGCGEYHCYDDTVYNGKDDFYYCRECYSSMLHTCSICTTAGLDSSEVVKDHLGQDVCRDCYEEEINND